MGLLQIDTISVVARSPYLVLFSRLGAYQSEWLEQALAGRKLFEYWAHEACFLPIEDFGLLRHRMLAPHDMGWKYSADWVQQHRAAMDSLLRHIEQQGPVRSADFSAEKKGNSGWWDWKPEKRHRDPVYRRQADGSRTPQLPPGLRSDRKIAAGTGRCASYAACGAGAQADAAPHLPLSGYLSR